MFIDSFARGREEPDTHTRTHKALKKLKKCGENVRENVTLRCLGVVHVVKTTKENKRLALL